MEIVKKSPFVRKRITRIGIVGNSRFAGSSTDVSTNYVNRGSVAAITPMLNLALQCRARVINPGETFSSAGSNKTLAAYAGFSESNLGFGTLAGHVKAALRLGRLDCLIIGDAYNDMNDLASATVAAEKLRMAVAFALENVANPVDKVVVFTTWGPGSKSQAAINQYNASARLLPNEFGSDRVLLVDLQALFEASPLLYYTIGESPAIHESVLGQDTIIAAILQVLEPYLPPLTDTHGWPLMETADYTANADVGVIYKNQFPSSPFFADDVPFAGAQVTGNGIAGTGTSVAGSVSTSSATSTLCSGNRATYTLINGASMQSTYLSESKNSLAVTPSIGDRLAICCGIQFDGLVAGESYANFSIIFATNTSLASSFTVTPIIKLHTSTYLGVRGLMYAEFTCAAAYTKFKTYIELQQRTNLSHASAGPYSGSVTLDNFTILNLTDIERSINGAYSEYGGINPKTTSSSISFPVVTTTQRDARVKIVGEIVYNTTLSKHQAWDGSAWNSLW